MMPAHDGGALARAERRLAVLERDLQNARERLAFLRTVQMLPSGSMDGVRTLMMGAGHAPAAASDPAAFRAFVQAAPFDLLAGHYRIGREGAARLKRWAREGASP